MSAGRRPRVYVSDLDGTLLGNDARLPERSRAILKRLLGQGLLFTVASARSVVAMRSILAGLTLDLPVIEFNGAFLSDLATGRHHVINDLGPELAEAVFALIREAGHLPFVSAFDGRRDRLYYSGIANPGMKWYLDDRLASGDRRVQRTDDLSGRLRERIVCFTVIDRPGRLEELHRELTRCLGERLSIRCLPNRYSPGWHWLTVHDRRSTKDRALTTLIERWDLSGAEVVAFGDGDNDIPLFRVAHRRVAVANASPELKALATVVIGRNDEDGVATFLESEWRAASAGERAERWAGQRMTESYYAANLSGERLRRCYEIASPRVKQYLRSEIDFVRERLSPEDRVLELGCGYGRVALELAGAAGHVIGIDTSRESLLLARQLAGDDTRCAFIEMDATNLRFDDREFDFVVCVQNGICAFGVDPLRLVREALRVTRAGGSALFSTYSARFWAHRLRWFEAQAAAELLGEIDYDETGEGTIVCVDGFRAGMLAPEGFLDLGRAIGIEPQITEVDGSSVFAEWRAPHPAAGSQPATT